MWFADGHRLEELFAYQTQSAAHYWAEIKKAHGYYSLAKIVPKALIRKLVIEHLRKDANAPAYWKKHGDIGKLTAFFGGEKEYDALPARWEDFPLLCEGKGKNGAVDYNALRDIRNAVPIDCGFDADKADEDITIADLRAAAKAHGGELVSETFAAGDLYTPVEWKTQDGDARGIGSTVRTKRTCGSSTGSPAKTACTRRSGTTRTAGTSGTSIR